MLNGVLITATSLFLFFVSSSNAFARVVINEFMVNSDPEWVEFYNSSGSAEYLKNYWIDDDKDFGNDIGNSDKEKLINLNVSNSTYPYIELSTFLNNDKDDVVLFDVNGKIVDSYVYRSKIDSGVSFGRHPDNTGSVSELESATKGGANSDPKPDPTSTPEPTSKPTATPKPTSTPKPTTAPTARKSFSSTPRVLPQQTSSNTKNKIDLEGRNSNSDVLGLRNQMKPTENDVELGDGSKDDRGGNFPWESILFILSGGGFIGSGVYLYKKYQKENSSEEKKKSTQNGFKLD